MNNKDTLYVIGAGQMRTGTFSLKIALEKLYGDKCYHMVELMDFHPDHMDLWIKAFDQGHIDRKICNEVFAGYVCAVDHPTSVFYKDLMEIYPNAKVILTTRNTDSWIKSVNSTTMKVFESTKSYKAILFRILGMGLFQEFGNKMMWHCFHETIESLKKDEVLRRVYEEYNDEVRRSVPKEKLLEFEAKDGWKPLCKFLDLPIPNEPYPFLNTTDEFQSRVKSKIFGKLLRFGAILTVAVAIGTLILKRYY